uniref:Chromodomain helicase DNA binding protein 8 n=1 Tax=Astyanax mexicanus TaxID=7994 RepID=A0A8B9RMX8_ASTMX
MLDKASLKLGLDRAVLQSMSGSKDSNVNGIQQFSKKEIEDLLRKGAYAAIMDENDEGSRFCEEDIDQILQRRATTITIESEGKGSTFSKLLRFATVMLQFPIYLSIYLSICLSICLSTYLKLTYQPWYDVVNIK